jgi:hypothetical protein
VGVGEGGREYDTGGIRIHMSMTKVMKKIFVGT